MPTDHNLTHPLAGPVRYQVTERCSRAPVTLLDDWPRDHLDRVRIPQLVGRPIHPGGGVHDGWVRWFRPAAGQLLAAFAEVEAEGLTDLILAVGEDFAPRLVTTVDDRPTTRLSAHALGLAIDLNPAQNPLGEPVCHFGLRRAARPETSPDRQDGQDQRDGRRRW